MKHAILGAGAIGGLVGTVLSSLGEEVTVVVRPEKLPELSRSLDVGAAFGLAHGAGESRRHADASRLTCCGLQPRPINCKLRWKLYK